MGQSYDDIYYSPSYVSVVTRNILITIIRFARCHFLLACSSTFMTDFMCFGTSQIYRNLNEHCYYFISTTSVTNRCKLFIISIPEYASISRQARTLKTDPLGLISNTSKYYFKTGTICLLFLSSHLFAALEFDSSHLVSYIEK